VGSISGRSFYSLRQEFLAELYLAFTPNLRGEIRSYAKFVDEKRPCFISCGQQAVKHEPEVFKCHLNILFKLHKIFVLEQQKLTQWSRAGL
jgi:hypothetical protein